MWIRSQDREQLKDCNNFEIDEFNNIIGNLDILGTYKTKERVLEVLDEIQVAILGKILIPNSVSIWDDTGIINSPRTLTSSIEQLPVVFEMPKGE